MLLGWTAGILNSSKLLFVLRLAYHLQFLEIFVQEFLFSQKPGLSFAFRCGC